MKLNFLIAGSIVLAAAACKTPYKATDRPISTDSTAIATDTAAARNLPGSTDSVFTKKDSALVDPTQQPMADSSMKPSQPDSARTNPMTDTSRAMSDTSRAMPEIDSTRMSQADSAAAQPTIDTSMSAMQAPANLEAAFTKQYPGATNMVWSHYDSLAAVPIDLRLAGWKKMDAEDYMVKFDHNDETYFAWYDSNGKWIGSASPMEDFTKLPAAVNTAVKNAIKTRYTDYNISQVNREFQTGKKAYEVELTKGDNKVRMLVTSAGKITQIYKYATEASK